MKRENKKAEAGLKRRPRPRDLSAKKEARGGLNFTGSNIGGGGGAGDK